MKIEKKFLLIAVFLLLLPRIFRFLYPEIWIEDPNYAYGGFLVLKGYKPYFDFAMPNLPLVEQVLAVFYKILGTGYLSAEILNQLLQFFTSLFIFLLLYNLTEFLPGLLGSIIYSLHPLIFRYHFFEKENFVSLTAIIMLLIYFSSFEKKIKILLVSFTGVIGICFKQSAILPSIAILFLILIFKDNFFKYLLSFITFGLIAFFIYFYFYGMEIIYQSLLFHFIKGSVAPVWVKIKWFSQGIGTIWLYTPLVFALFFIFSSDNSLLKLITYSLTHLILEFIFSVMISASFWPHFLIPALIPIVIIISLIFYTIHRFIGSPYKTLLITLILAVIFLSPFIKGFYIQGLSIKERLGFGGVKRKKVRELKILIDKYSLPSEKIISPPFEALVGKRLKEVNFKDNWGLMLWLKASIKQGKFKEFKNYSKSKNFADMRVESRKFWLPIVVANLKKRVYPVVLMNYELPVSEKFLVNLGYTYVGKWFQDKIFIRNDRLNKEQKLPLKKEQKENEKFQP